MSDDHVLAPGTAPTPFSAGEIRAGCPAGRTVVVRVEGGVVSGEVQSIPVTWLDLQRHASFPAAATTRDEGAHVTTIRSSRRRPGMPVQVTSRHGDRLLSTSVMVSDRVVGSSDD